MLFTDKLIIKLNLSLHDCCSSVGETVRLPIGSAIARFLILTAIFRVCVTIQRSFKHSQILFERMGLVRDELRNEVERR